jgi:hypothetical protein
VSISSECSAKVDASVLRSEIIKAGRDDQCSSLARHVPFPVCDASSLVSQKLSARQTQADIHFIGCGFTRHVVQELNLSNLSRHGHLVCRLITSTFHGRWSISCIVEDEHGDCVKLLIFKQELIPRE